VGTGQNKVLRGGSWNNNDNNLRVANRNNNNPANRNNNIGFRCVAPPGKFLKGQVRGVGRAPTRAVAESEISRPVPGWLIGQPKINMPRPVW
jgi:hypothetical protein